jgi:hypothetical protein
MPRTTVKENESAYNACGGSALRYPANRLARTSDAAAIATGSIARRAPSLRLDRSGEVIE